MFHTLVQVGLLALTLGSPLTPPSLETPVIPIVQSVDPPPAPEAGAVEGAGFWGKLFCVGCLAALLSGGTSVAAVVVTALANPNLAFACTGICVAAF